MTFEELTTLIGRAEFHRFLKIEPIEADAGAGTLLLKLPFDDAYTIYRETGNYHGGIVASLIDVAGAMACSLIKGHPTPTVNLRIDFLQTPRRVDLYAEGHARRAGRAVGVADVTVRDAEGTVYALGRGTFSTSSVEPKLFEKRD